ncbi:hypothetical protein PAMP_012384 [Pampus punctatissimus]
MFIKHSCARSVEKNRETGYRGNAVSSSVKNSVGERHRIERWREVKRREGRSGSRSRTHLHADTSMPLHSVRPSSISGQPISAPTTPTAAGSTAYATLFPTSLTVHSFVSLHQYCCPSTDQSFQQEDREEGEDEGAHQFCCSASGCSSPSSR